MYKRFLAATGVVAILVVMFFMREYLFNFLHSFLGNLTAVVVFIGIVFLFSVVVNLFCKVFPFRYRDSIENIIWSIFWVIIVVGWILMTVDKWKG